MKITCDYCGGLFDDTLTQCPNCGGVNKNVRRSTIDQPVTIEELAQWYADRGLPPYETTRFFIGENHQGPRAFGIYKDGNNFIVYKNKDDGSRAVRYEGTDEAYAVNELFQRLKQEIVEQKAGRAGSSAVESTEQVSQTTGNSDGRKQKSVIGKIIRWVVLLYALYLLAQGVFGLFGPKMLTMFGSNKDKIQDGYYQYCNETYYHDTYNLQDLWYEYDYNTQEWDEVDKSNVPEELKTNSKDFYDTSVWNPDSQYTDFSTVEKYQHSSYSSSDSNDSWYNDDSSSYDWGSDDSWDSGSTDWGSDW